MKWKVFPPTCQIYKEKVSNIIQLLFAKFSPSKIQQRKTYSTFLIQYVERCCANTLDSFLAGFNNVIHKKTSLFNEGIVYTRGNFYKRRTQPLKLFDFQLQLFCHTCMKFQGHTQCKSQIIELEPRTPLKKIDFSGLILKKLRLG